MLTAQYKNALVGAHYGVVAGRRYSYIMGGTERIESLKTGHILHWSAMKKARDLNLLGYDFTSGGSPGVMRFKMGFRPDHIHFIEPRYYVFSEARYKVFNLVYPWARRHRGQISKILSVVFGALRTEAKA
jgi:lipid II:glycine glycyltransferase (peptidoglycan interpeptide bridge formation enzyme)